MLDVVTICFIDKMNKNLKQPITKMELKESIEEIAIGKALGPNGNVALEFFIKFWPIIG